MASIWVLCQRSECCTSGLLHNLPNSLPSSFCGGLAQWHSHCHQIRSCRALWRVCLILKIPNFFMTRNYSWNYRTRKRRQSGGLADAQSAVHERKNRIRVTRTFTTLPLIISSLSKFKRSHAMEREKMKPSLSSRWERSLGAAWRTQTYETKIESEIGVFCLIVRHSYLLQNKPSQRFWNSEPGVGHRVNCGTCTLRTFSTTLCTIQDGTLPSHSWGASISSAMRWGGCIFYCGYCGIICPQRDKSEVS